MVVYSWIGRHAGNRTDPGLLGKLSSFSLGRRPVTPYLISLLADANMRAVYEFGRDLSSPLSWLLPIGLLLLAMII